MLHHKIHSVAACCENQGIGLAGNLPWRLENELDYYRKMLKGNPPPGKKNVVIYGRKTSGKPMEGCYNIVFSRTMKEKQPWMDAVVKSLDELVALLTTDEWLSKTHTIYNVGGAEIFKLIHDTPLCGRVYLTRIKADFEADTFFPELDKKHFKLLDRIPDDVADIVPCGMQVDKGVEWFVEVYESTLTA